MLHEALVRIPRVFENVAASNVSWLGTCHGRPLRQIANLRGS